MYTSEIAEDKAISDLVLKILFGITSQFTVASTIVLSAKFSFTVNN